MYIVLVPVRDHVGKSKSDGQAMTNEQYANRFVEWNIGGVALLSGRQDQGMLQFSFFLLCFLIIVVHVGGQALPTDLGHWRGGERAREEEDKTARTFRTQKRGGEAGGSSTVLFSAVTATIPPSTRLRKRANKGDEAGREADSPEKDPGGTSTSTGIAESCDDQQMAYGRRTINFYQRGTVGGDSVPISSYKNKILVFLAATAVYTAFLWKSGGSFSFSLQIKA